MGLGNFIHNILGTGDGYEEYESTYDDDRDEYVDTSDREATRNAWSWFWGSNVRAFGDQADEAYHEVESNRTDERGDISFWGRSGWFASFEERCCSDDDDEYY